MAWCRQATNYYLNHCWLIISEVLWHSPDGNFTWNAQDICLWHISQKNNYQFKIIATLASERCENNLVLYFSKSFYELISWALPVKLALGECHWTPLMISQHWFNFRQCLGAVRQQAIIWDTDLSSLGHNESKWFHKWQEIFFFFTHLIIFEQETDTSLTQVLVRKVVSFLITLAQTT